ncbi:MAG: CrcB family protein [Clostridiaceae bacterium]
MKEISLKEVLVVSLVGSLGAVMRYQFRLIQSNYPFDTLLVNLIGAFLLGVVYELRDRGKFKNKMMPVYLGAGFLGSFTTFSAMIWETVQPRLITGVPYIFISVILGVCLARLGRKLGERL